MTTLSSWISCGILLIAFLSVSVLLWRLQSMQSRTLERLFSTHQETLSSSLSPLLQSLDRAQALVAASDPLAYQAIQAMAVPPQYSDADFDPSPEGEIRRIAQRDGVSRVEDTYDDGAFDDVTYGALRDLS